MKFAVQHALDSHLRATRWLLPIEPTPFHDIGPSATGYMGTRDANAHRTYLQLRLGLHIFLPSLQVGMSRLDRPCNGIKCKTRRFRRELHLRANVEKRKVPSDQMMSDSCGFIQNIDLSAYYILGLFARIVERLRWSSFDFIKAGSQVAWRVGSLSTDTADIRLCQESVCGSRTHE